MVGNDHQENRGNSRFPARFGTSILGAILGTLIGLLISVLFGGVDWVTGAAAGLLVGTGLTQIIDRRRSS